MGPVRKITDGVEEILEKPASLDPTGVAESVLEVTGDVVSSVSDVIDEIFGW